MNSHLNLIKTSMQVVEKRVFPRFPFTYLMFKSSGDDQENIFEVYNISYAGMQLNLKNGSHSYKVGDKVEGELKWRSNLLSVDGEVKWLNDNQIGISFKDCNSIRNELTSFLSIENIMQSMRPIHESAIEIEKPNNLKYWLRADCPVELFIWEHSDGELSNFQVIMLDNFIEWQDCKGIKSGLVLNRKDIDTPLTNSGECEFEIDEGLDIDKLKFAQAVVTNLSEDLIPVDVIDFLKLKLNC